MTKTLIWTCFSLCFLCSCATYHLGHYKRALPGGYDRIAVPVFQNKTDEVGIEAFFTKALRIEFERSGLAQVTGKNDAQVILEGTVSNLTITGGDGVLDGTLDNVGLRTPYPQLNPQASPSPSPTPMNNPLAKGVTLNRSYTSVLTVKITARKVSDNSVLWQSDFTSQRNYSAALIGTPALTPANPLYNQNAKVNIIEKQAQDMMSEAHDRLTENF